MKNRKPQNARNARRKLLINRGVNKLPRKIIPILKFLGIPAYKYGDNQGFIKNNSLRYVASKSDGFTVLINGTYYIFYDEKKSISHIQFTLAHELGHIIHGHMQKETKTQAISTQNNTLLLTNSDPMEQEANVFACRLLLKAKGYDCFYSDPFENDTYTIFKNNLERKCL